MDTNEMEQQGIWDEAFEKGEQSGKLATLKDVLKELIDNKSYWANNPIEDFIECIESKIKELEK